MVMLRWSVDLTTLFFLGKLRLHWKPVFCAHKISLVTDNSSSWISGRRRMTVENINESMGPGRDQTHDPWKQIRVGGGGGGGGWGGLWTVCKPCFCNVLIWDPMTVLRIRYGKTCLKQPLKSRSKIDFQDWLLLNAGQRYCRMLPLGTFCNTFDLY